jgi:hypothetical protein
MIDMHALGHPPQPRRSSADQMLNRAGQVQIKCLTAPVKCRSNA